MDAEPQINMGSDMGQVAANIYGDAWKSAEKFDKQTDEGIKKMESEKLPSPPEMKESPKPQDYSTDPMHTFGSAAMFLSVFGSLLTKNPLETALNSGAGVMKAANAKDANSFKQAMDKFRIDTDNAWKMANYNQDLYKTVLGKDEAELRARAVSAKDNVMIHMADAKMGAQLYKDRERNLEKFNKGKEENDKLHEVAQSAYDKVMEGGGTENEANKAYLKAFGEEKAAVAGKDNPSGLPENDKGIKFRIGLASTGDPSAFQNISRGKSGDTIRNAIWDGLAAEPNMTPEKLAALHLKFKSLTSEEGSLGTQTAKLATAGAEFDRMANLAEDASDKVDRSQYPTLNKAIEAYDAGTGDTAVVSLVTNARGAVNTWARAINPNGVATVEATTAGTHLLDVAYSKGQFSEALKQMRNETKAARAAPSDVQKSIGDQVNPQSGSSGVEAPEGTIIHNGSITKVKKDGKWVIQ